MKRRRRSSERVKQLISGEVEVVRNLDDGTQKAIKLKNLVRWKDEKASDDEYYDNYDYGYYDYD